MGLPPAMPFPFFERVDDIVVYTGPALLRGWAFHNASAAVDGNLVIYDGDSGADLMIAPITLTPGESTRDYPSGDGIMIRTSLYVAINAGSIEGSLWLTPLTFAEDVAFAFGQSGPFYAPHI